MVPRRQNKNKIRDRERERERDRQTETGREKERGNNLFDMRQKEVFVVRKLQYVQVCVHITPVMFVTLFSMNAYNNRHVL